MNTKISENAVAVDPDYHWRPINNDTPQGVKMLLIDKSHGVATIGIYTKGCTWSHWVPLPKFRRDEA